jgi:3'(2'), 5'-bisphosphate nucleotidase
VTDSVRMSSDDVPPVTTAAAAVGRPEPAPGELGDTELAAWLATQAGRLLTRIRETTGFADAAALRTAGDAGAQEMLSAALARYRPADAVLSEEAVDDPARLRAERVWIVDPLDGTREFAEPGRSDWAVHVALWAAGDLVTGAVALPAVGVTLRGAVGSSHGASGAAGAPVRAPAIPPRLVASRSRAPRVVYDVAAALGATIVPMGSAGAKAAAVIRGEAEIYLHAGGQHEWDSAAPVAVARARGLHTSRIDGSPLRYNQPDPSLPDLLICHPDLADRALREIGLAARDSAERQVGRPR